MRNLFLFSLLLITVFACQKENTQQNELINEETHFMFTIEEQDYLEQVYYELNQNPDINITNFQEQFTYLSKHTKRHGSNLQASYDQLVGADYNEKYHNYLKAMTSIYNSPTSKNIVSLKLDEYRNDLLKKEILSEGDILFIDICKEAFKFMIQSPQFNIYAENMNNQINSSTLESRCSEDCNQLITLTGILTLVCPFTPPVCIAAGIAGAATGAECSSCQCDNSPDPCCGSNDPCCGNSDPCCQVFCAQGYECNNGQCVFVGYDCNNCLPGETCINGYCQPF